MRRSGKTITFRFSLALLAIPVRYHLTHQWGFIFAKCSLLEEQRFLKVEINQINELIAAHEKAMVMEAVDSLPDTVESDDPDVGCAATIR